MKKYFLIAASVLTVGAVGVASTNLLSNSPVTVVRADENTEVTANANYYIIVPDNDERVANNIGGFDVSVVKKTETTPGLSYVPDGSKGVIDTLNRQGENYRQWNGTVEEFKAAVAKLADKKVGEAEQPATNAKTVKVVTEDGKEIKSVDENAWKDAKVEVEKEYELVSGPETKDNTLVYTYQTKFMNVKAKVNVQDVNKLTQAEKDEVAKAVKETNPSKTVEVKDNGSVLLYDKADKSDKAQEVPASSLVNAIAKKEEPKPAPKPAEPTRTIPETAIGTVGAVLTIVSASVATIVGKKIKD